MVTTSYFFQNCRDGFNHVAILIVNGEIINRAKVHYINRTWESYNGQTARRRVCANELAQMEAAAVRRAKDQTGRRRVCPVVKNAAAVILANNSLYNDIKKHYNSL